MHPPTLKTVLPRSLFGRALLILLVPLVLLQLVVGLIFFQRHYQRVTEQLTRGVALELAYAVSEVEAAPERDTANQRLASIADQLRLILDLDPQAVFTPQLRRGWNDLTGRTLIATLEAEVPRTLAIDVGADERQVRIAMPTSKGVLTAEVPRNRLTVSNPHQLLVLMLIASCVLGTVAVLFLRNQVRPIRQLAEAAEAFGKGRSSPFRPSGAEEVRRAGAAFQHMRARIERQIDQRTLMLSGVSHDLRTPLTRMKLTLALMVEGEETEGLREDIDQMERMLGEFLAFARGGGTEEAVEVDPFDLTRRIVEDAERGGQAVVLTQTDETPADHLVILRPQAMRRAVENLIGNARRHGTKTALSVRLTSKWLEFVVEDDGPGIAAEDRNRAVAPFARLDEARDPNMGGGVGLGLTIATDIARSHGGSLDLGTSARLGGLRAALRIPR